MKSKKILSLLLAGTMSFVFAGCSFLGKHAPSVSSSNFSSASISSSSTIEDSSSSSGTPEELYAFSIVGAPTETVTTGDRIELNASLTLNGASIAGITVEWSSSNNAIISVEDGVLTVLGAGTTTITATCMYEGQTYTDSCEIVSELKVPTEAMWTATVTMVDVSGGKTDISNLINESERSGIGSVGSTIDVTEVANTALDTVSVLEGYELDTENSILSGVITVDGLQLKIVYCQKVDVFTQEAFAVMASASTYEGHDYGTPTSVTATKDEVTISATAGTTAGWYGGFTFTEAAVRELLDLGCTKMTFTFTSDSPYVCIWSFVHASVYITNTAEGVLNGNDVYFASGSTITVDLDIMTTFIKNGIGFKVAFSATNSWVGYKSDKDITMTLSNFSFTKAEESTPEELVFFEDAFAVMADESTYAESDYGTPTSVTATENTVMVSTTAGITPDWYGGFTLTEEAIRKLVGLGYTKMQFTFTSDSPYICFWTFDAHTEFVLNISEAANVSNGDIYFESGSTIVLDLEAMTAFIKNGVGLRFVFTASDSWVGYESSEDLKITFSNFLFTKADPEQCIIYLDKEENKDFTILNLSDPQLPDWEWTEGHQNREILEYTIEQLIAQTNPDLITVTGDISYSGNVLAYKMFAETIEKYEIPWTVVWGNHDQEQGQSFIAKIEKMYMSYPHFVYETGNPAFGGGNFVIAIREGEEIVEALIMMNSHDEEPYIDDAGNEQMTWSKLTSEQIVWLREQTKILKEKGCKDATLMLHIPIYAYRLASKAAYKDTVDLSKLTVQESEGTECWNEGYEDSVGVQHEPKGVCSHPVDDGVFTAIKEDGLIKHVLAGHDHMNNWIIPYEGITLMYALTTGAGCYWEPNLSGGTVLKVNQDGVYEVFHEYINVDHLL